VLVKSTQPVSTVKKTKILNTTMKILLKGYYGFGNLGDDILLKVSWRIVSEKYRGASIFVYSNFNENLRGFNQSENYNHYIFKLTNTKVELIDWTGYHEFDLVLDGGGGVYFDYTKGSLLTRFTNKFSKWIGAEHLYKLDQLLRRLTGKQRHIQFKKRIGVGLGIGPYVPAAKLFYHHLVEIGSTDVMLVRDPTSLAELQQVKFSGATSLCADLAFFSEYWMSGISKEKNDGSRVGIILLDWHEGMSERFEVFRNFADDLIKSGNRVTFFSFDENHDKVYREYFQNRYSFVVWKPNETTLDSFLKGISSQGIIFSARAHGIIVSSLLGVPTVCIGTSKKLIEVSKLFPTSSSLINEPVKVETLHEQWHRINNNYDDVLKSLTRDVDANKQLAKETLIKLHQYL